MHQQKLSTFFKPTFAKRSASKQFQNDNSENKKIKFAEVAETEPSLIQTQRNEIVNDYRKTIGDSWFRALKDQFSKPYFLQLIDFIEKERQTKVIYPPKNQIFTFTNITDINKIRVVIIGQDPYHNVNQAHGLCFSVNRGIAIPPSLQNIYKELQNDIEDFKNPGHGYLLRWAEQGVLLLNAVLTVRQNEANSHKDKGWEQFTDSIINFINKNNPSVVFMLWGSYAQKKCYSIDKKKHHILTSTHPSPLSAHRGFLGCKHFSKCNKILKDKGYDEIDWLLH